MHSIIKICILLFLAITIVNVHGNPTSTGGKKNSGSSESSGEKKSGSSSESGEKKKCGKDEEYNKCGSACPLSCNNYYYPGQKKVCTQQCVPGCFCKSGLYRGKDGKCVKPKDCCQGKNEYYTTCGTACPERCGYKPQICTAQCVVGCFCQVGYVRKDSSAYSLCIKKDQCYYG